MPQLGKKRFPYTGQGMQDYVKALKRKRALKRNTVSAGYGDQKIRGGQDVERSRGQKKRKRWGAGDEPPSS